jgi:nitroreductase
VDERGASRDVWEVLSTNRSIRRFTDEPVGDDVLRRCLEAATWAPNGANAQAWRFVVLRSPEARAAVAEAARQALGVIESVYRMTRPDPDDDSRTARSNRATYELHDRAGERTSVLFLTYRYESASELLLGGSIYPAMENFLLAARAQGLGTCVTSWASYGGAAQLREAVGVPDDWLLAGHVVVGWPKGHHGPVRRRPLADVVHLDRWDQPAVDIAGEPTPGAGRDVLGTRGLDPARLRDPG